LPALDLHPEPVVHQRVPQVFLALDESPVRAVERPLRGAIGHPAGRAGLALAPLGDLALGRLRVPLGLVLPPLGLALPPLGLVLPRLGLVLPRPCVRPRRAGAALPSHLKLIHVRSTSRRGSPASSTHAS